MPLPQRLAILDKAAKIMQGEFEELAMAAVEEGGKPLLDSRIEVARAIDGVKLCIETMRTEAGQLVPMGANPASVGKVAFTTRDAGMNKVLMKASKTVALQYIPELLLSEVQN